MWVGFFDVEMFFYNEGKVVVAVVCGAHACHITQQQTRKCEANRKHSCGSAAVTFWKMVYVSNGEWFPCFNGFFVCLIFIRCFYTF